ncbi:hypothetical protein [Luteibacter sp. CQ10]|uniref:hypothetical protein n=1 Tax=Luteibacter sp. CQ10 TaxID=2805821 RepID=UPI0034A2F3C9
MPAPEIGSSKDAIQSFLQLHDFIDKVVAPWATQARISQTIATDYDTMSNTLSKAFDSAVQRSFSGSASGSSRITYLTPVFKPPTERQPGATPILINHGAMDWEVLDGRQVVQCYTTVFRENPDSNWNEKAGAAAKFKDVQQGQDGKVQIYEGRDGEKMDYVGIFFVSIGQPLRALKWLEKYNATGGQAIIRQYAIPAEDYVEFATAATPERFGGDGLRSINVDVHAASDQYGLRQPHIDTLKKKVIDHSLVSYTDHMSAINKARGGRVLPASELRRRLGVPEGGMRALEVFVSKRAGDFQNRHKFESIADLLMSLYGVWWSNDQYLSDQWRSMPVAKRWLRLRNELKSRGVQKEDDVWKLVEACYGGNHSPGMHARRILESQGAT